MLVRLYPAAHRRAFGEQMVQAFGDHYRDAVEGRGGSRVRFWLAVLADARSSLLTEYAAEFRARSRRPDAPPRGRRSRPARRARVRRRLRYRPRARRRVRVMAMAMAMAMVVALVGVGLGLGAVTGHLAMSALLVGPVLVVGLVAAAWLAYRSRLTRVPAGPRGDGPAPPGGASMREPRRPLPMSPAGSAARPGPDSQEPPGQAVALI